MVEFEFLQAENGDCIFISFDDDQHTKRNILIDGGTSRTYSFKNSKGKLNYGPLALKIEELKSNPDKGKIDLLMVTHTDADHIGGILKWIESDADFPKMVRRIWFNSRTLLNEHYDQESNRSKHIPIALRNGNNTSIAQGLTFEKHISKLGIWDNNALLKGQYHKLFGLKISILSPSKERLERFLKEMLIPAPKPTTSSAVDYDFSIFELSKNDVFEEDEAVSNGSSIAIKLEFCGANFLLFGDAHPSVLVEGLRELGYDTENKISAEFVKLSHHGSKYNTSPELLSIIDVKKFIISTNGSHHGLPHKQCLARIIQHIDAPTFVFNYPELSKRIFSEQDKLTFQFQTLNTNKLAYQDA